MEHLSDKNKKIIRNMGSEMENAIINIFQLAEIEDRYTEKEIIMDACAAICELLNLAEDRYLY